MPMSPELRARLEKDYPLVLDVPGDRFAAVMPLMFTAAIIDGPLRGAEFGYEGRWCYGGIAAATAALGEWAARSFEGEPEGWHRDVPSGRRRPHGNKDDEYINY